MFKSDAREAMPIVVATANALLSWAPTQGRPGAYLRNRVGYINADVERLLMNDALGQPMSQAFQEAIDCGVNLDQIQTVRQTTQSFQPVSIGATVVRAALIHLALVTEGTIIANSEWTSRQAVEAIHARMNEAFSEATEAAADQLDAMSFQALVALHAAIAFFLIELARPIPAILNYRFNQPMTTLTIAYRLYADATRADVIRNENKIIHPAFAPRNGKALAA